ncbi:SDR family oxidoreductase [Alloacidobacterium dinghuense]|uniref:SDR family oxidoreductase n=1 Tax=Alloacidobacterium dinghuense TaxID=2763107 RepID=A0A7G8BHK3_9BACT|nr:SDR family oxidoreductase [Alloacidobacterium dinghuense]QNI32023.1 SDR family oxidoreductase [Alloacidobacterium dinghuense]
MILVVGATGLVGSDVCLRLAKRGEPVRALVRVTSDKNKVEALRSAGVELCFGDLKEPESLAVACRGASAVVSTASSTLSRAAGDSIETVDAAGQLSLVSAARAARVNRFVFVSFRQPKGMSVPLAEAKAQVESAIAKMNFTSIQASWFMEVWLGPHLGFDYQNATARIYGPGTSPISWVSSGDVAEMCVLALEDRAAERRIIEFGGPEPLSPLEVVALFEEIGGKKFKVEHVPEEVLRGQFAAATDSMQKSFAALMLGYAYGDAMEMGAIQKEFGIKLKSVDEYAREFLYVR